MNLSIGYNHRKHGNGGHGSAVSLPQNNHEHSMRDVTIARLIVGKRHCRVLILGNITSGCIGIVQDFGRTKVLTTNFRLHPLQYLNPQQS